MAQEHEAICPRSLGQTAQLLLPAPHHKVQILSGHRRCKAAGRWIGNGQQMLTRVMIMPVDQVEQVGCVYILLYSGSQSSEEAVCVYQCCYLNRLQHLSFCHLGVIKTRINQVLCISGAVFLKTRWICIEEEGNKKLGFYWDIKKICRHSTKGRSLQLLDVLLPRMLKLSAF